MRLGITLTRVQVSVMSVRLTLLLLGYLVNSGTQKSNGDHIGWIKAILLYNQTALNLLIYNNIYHSYTIIHLQLSYHHTIRYVRWNTHYYACHSYHPINRRSQWFQLLNSQVVSLSICFLILLRLHSNPLQFHLMTSRL